MSGTNLIRWYANNSSLGDYISGVFYPAEEGAGGRCLELTIDDPAVGVHSFLEVLKYWFTHGYTSLMDTRPLAIHLMDILSGARDGSHSLNRGSAPRVSVVPWLVPDGVLPVPRIGLDCVTGHHTRKCRIPHELCLSTVRDLGNSAVVCPSA